MKNRLKTIIASIFTSYLSIILLGCGKETPDNSHKTVHIKYEKKQYTLYRNGKPFFIKGAAGFTNLKKLKEAGGNTIRTWDTTHLQAILDEAKIYDIAVVVGLPMPMNNDGDWFYKNDELIATQYKRYSSFINKYKNHPSLLCWCLGNELAFPNKPRFLSFYRVFNNLVNMIHQNDPNHLVTTTITNFQRKNIFHIKFRTNIDFISFNIFGKLKDLRKDLEDFEWLWDGPFLITEWGIDGPWYPHEHTAWRAFIENTSTKKAEQYLWIYRHDMPVENPRLLGSLVFYWGHKQENTPTWFSLFDENGASSEAVGTMKYIWTSTYPTHKAPQIRYMVVDGKGARDNLIYQPNANATAKLLLMDKADTTGLTYQWQVLPEDWFQVNDIYSTKKVKPIENVFIKQSKTTVVFRTPPKEGPYRIYVSVYDKHGNFATCNTPFYVVDNK